MGGCPGPARVGAASPRLRRRALVMVYHMRSRDSMLLTQRAMIHATRSQIADRACHGETLVRLTWG
jgi:hypothetical protein